MSDLFLPVKTALGQYMGRFHHTLSEVNHNDSPAVQAFAARELKRSIVFAPARMGDAIEQILSAWRKNTNQEGQTQSTAFLPVIAVAVSRDYTPLALNHGRLLGEKLDVVIPQDTEGRRLKLQVIRGQLRVQVIIMAADDSTAKSLIARFCHFVRDYPNRGFDATYNLAGLAENWFNTWESQGDLFPQAVTLEQTNLAVQKVDLMLNIAIPMVQGASFRQAHDGRGTGEVNNPHGYPVVTKANFALPNFSNKVL